MTDWEQLTLITDHYSPVSARRLTHPPLLSSFVPFPVDSMSACSSNSTPAWAETNALGPCTCWPIELWNMHLNGGSEHVAQPRSETNPRMCLNHTMYIGQVGVMLLEGWDNRAHGHTLDNSARRREKESIFCIQFKAVHMNYCSIKIGTTV